MQMNGILSPVDDWFVTEFLVKKGTNAQEAVWETGAPDAAASAQRRVRSPFHRRSVLRMPLSEFDDQTDA